MNKWMAEFDLEDGDTMPEHMDLEYKGAKIDFHCKPLEQEPCEDCISRKAVLDKIKEVYFSREQEWVDFRVSQGSNGQRDLIINFIEDLPSVQPKPKTEVLDKIRTEITNYQKQAVYSDDVVMTKRMILAIIDKYKAESEGT